MLTSEERTIVRRALEEILLPTAAQFQKQLIQNIFPVGDELFLKELDSALPNARDYSTVVVRICMRERWNHQPQCLMELLLTDLVTRGKANLAPLRDRVRQKIDPNLDPLQSSWITANQPFFGRPATRTRVKQLLDAPDQPILLVQGEPHSGKSYTSDWLDYLAAEQRCDFVFILETLDKGGGPTMTPDVLADSLVAKLGNPQPGPMPPQRLHRWEKLLCNWIIKEALAKKQLVWIVLDGFDTPNLDRDTAALIQELAAAILTGEVNRKVRLVLIDFQSKLVQVNDAKRIPDATPKPDDVGPDHIKDCLRQHLTDVKTDHDDDFVEALACRLHQEADLLGSDPEFSSEPRLKRLNRVVYNFRIEDLKRPRDRA